MMMQTAGSIIGPAEVNNIVGCKPSRGLISNNHVILVSTRQNAIGLLITTVKDAAYFLDE